MSEKPNFEALRKERNEAVQKMVAEIATEKGCSLDQIHTTFDPNACYCACPEGPCEHDFQGWRDVHDDDGRVCGGETVCSRCGLGAMSHSMRVGL